MAEAGFVFLPTDSEPDRVKCPYCQRCFSGFNKASNPWTQHEKASPNCTFVTRWRATLPAKKSLIPQKRRINSENKKRSLPSTSKPTPKSNRRATTTGANHIADDDEQEERSRFDDSIWDIAKMQLDHKPNDPTAHPPRSTGTKPLITYTPKKKPQKKLAKMLPPEITKPTSFPATNGKPTADGLTGLQNEPTRSSTLVTHGETPAEVLTRLQKGSTQPSPLTSKGKEKATDSLPSRLSTDDGTMSLRSDQRFLTSEPKTPQHDLMNRMPHSTPKHARNDFWDLTSLTLSPIRSNPFGAFGNNLDTPRRSQQAEEEEEDIAKQIERRFKQKQRYESQPSTPLLDFDDTTTTTGLGITTLLSDQELSMTVEEYLNIMMERKVAHVKQQGASMIKAIRDEVANTKQSILDSI